MVLSLLFRLATLIQSCFLSFLSDQKGFLSYRDHPPLIDSTGASTIGNADVAEHYTCPAYASIRQPSVRSDAFDIRELAHLNQTWYLVATSEPAIPKFCTCGANNFHINEAEQTYWYENTEVCDVHGSVHFNMSARLAGKLSQDPEWPGELQENIAVLGRRVLPLVPNFIFHVERQTHVVESPTLLNDFNERFAPINLIFTYACPFGKSGPKVFSLNILSRTPTLTKSQIEAAVARAVAKTGNLLDTRSLRYSDAEAYAKCSKLRSDTVESVV
eukprot:TRINITY_DN44361_c0_g1_i1.p1 TRINITY_DN44361_c0_g1~~TRINITY_DN44361_c0_g1_i1.p1  ORF type:complete len:273 (-),score=22.10 TRINITY_DN44361_c0_g1_i1:351-1169(-)